jgi:hypothetical protein
MASFQHTSELNTIILLNQTHYTKNWKLCFFALSPVHGCNLTNLSMVYSVFLMPGEFYRCNFFKKKKIEANISSDKKNLTYFRTDLLSTIVDLAIQLNSVLILHQAAFPDPDHQDINFGWFMLEALCK